MEANGSWLVPTHQAAGHQLRRRAAAEGPGRAGSRRSTRRGAVVYKGSKSPDAAWAFVQYLASPAAQEQLMQLKASLPVSKEVLAGPYATSFDGAQGLRRQPRLRQAQAVVQGLRRVLDDAPGGARHQRVQRPQQDGEGRARGGRPAAQRPAGRRPVAGDGAVDPARRRRPATAPRAPARVRGGGRCCSWRPPSSGWRCSRPGRSSPRSRSASRSGTCSRRRSSSASTTSSTSPTTRGS